MLKFPGVWDLSFGSAEEGFVGVEMDSLEERRNVKSDQIRFKSGYKLKYL